MYTLVLSRIMRVIFFKVFKNSVFFYQGLENSVLFTIFSLENSYFLIKVFNVLSASDVVVIYCNKPMSHWFQMKWIERTTGVTQKGGRYIVTKDVNHYAIAIIWNNYIWHWKTWGGRTNFIEWGMPRGLHTMNIILYGAKATIVIYCSQCNFPTNLGRWLCWW